MKAHSWRMNQSHRPHSISFLLSHLSPSLPTFPHPFHLKSLLIVIIIVGFSTGTNTWETNAPCIEQKDCGSCMSASPSCAWCSDLNLSSNEHRCNLESGLTKNCSSSFINNQRSHDISEEDNSSHSSGSPIEITPQKVTLKLRPNETFTLPVKFKMAENHPVDIYFVLDTSHTMKTYSKSLANLVQYLVKNISVLTSSYRFGFGSFVDKVVLPFVSTDTDNTIIPCSGCVPAYGFLNHMNLTSDIDAFQITLENLKISGNLDAPEGGFDAIIQAVACEEIIGWRNNSRKMVILFTDAPFHAAGDGKLGGIVEPNDLKCHLDDKGYYTESTNQDYPSIYQLASAVEGYKVNLIFAVTQNQVELYMRLKDCIAGSRVGVLGNESDVISLVSDIYYEIQSSIHISVDTPDDVEVLIRSSCDENGSSEKKNTSVCHGIKMGREITFDIVTTAKFCSSQGFDIKLIGLNEKIKVHIDMICSCGCQKDKEEKSILCERNGDLECGACQCDDDHYGTNCRCSKEDSGIVSDAPCIRPNDINPCSDRGSCSCGQCQCHETYTSNTSKKYYGKFCECNDYNCDYSSGKLCGGNGVCRCGTCMCNSNFTGSSCTCSLRNDDCMAANGAICNNQGNCLCGACVCFMNTPYKGLKCEECPTCSGKCQENGVCASCYLTSDYDKCSKDCPPATIVSDLPKISSDEQSCQYRDDDHCYVKYVYNSTSNSILVQRTKECIKRIEYWVIVSTVIGGIVAMGFLALIIWKIVVTIYDIREYRAFENEKQNAKWHSEVNPLYKAAVSNFTNPTFKSKEHLS